MTTLRARIQSLAETFTAGIVDAIRGASLQELLAAGGGGAPAKRGPGRPAQSDGGGGQPDPLARAHGGGKRRKAGRLARRSASDLEHVIGLIVAKLGENKTGLRSEQLQKALRLDKREITRPLELALAAKKISKKGQKRSTTYFASK